MPKTEERGKVLPFRDPRKRSRKPLSENGSVLDKEACIALLEGFARVTGDLKRQLELPDRLFMVGKGPSISSDPEKNIGELAFSLMTGKDPNAALLKDAPDYALQMGHRSSSAFCILMDKRRKIIVMESLGNSLGGDISWDGVAAAIEAAVQDREERTKRGEKFGFILSLEAIARAI